MKNKRTFRVCIWLNVAGKWQPKVEELCDGSLVQVYQYPVAFTLEAKAKLRAQKLARDLMEEPK